MQNINADYKITVSELGIRKSDFANYLPSSETDIQEYFSDIFISELEKITDYKIKAGIRVYKSMFKRGQLVVDRCSFNIGNVLAKQLKATESIAVFAITIGANLEEKLLQYNNQTQMSELYIADVLGNIIIDKTSLMVQNKLSELLLKYSLKATNTISPGNCGWEIEDQFKLFELLPENYLGITLNKSGMMHPAKSLSGIIGIGEHVQFIHSDCSVCNSKNCPYRKK